MTDTAGRVTNCARFQRQTSDAVFDSLPADALAAFNAHVRDCADCRGEFHRVQTMLQAIDRTLSANLAAEPSSALVANVRENIRQNINLQPHRAGAWTRWSAWATAAGVCVAFALLLLVARTWRKSSPSLHGSATLQTSASSTSKLISHPTLNAAITDAITAQPHKRSTLVVHHASLRTTHRNAAEPEVIVQPGQMQAILRFAAAMQRGQIDGAQFLADQKTLSEPLEIKPLTVAPLKIKPLDADSAPPNSPAGSEGSEKLSVSDHSD